MTGIYNILLAGVGGQGVISAAGLLARSAILSGLDVRMYGSYGMAQRGGSVSAHLRIGERVLNARIENGDVHMLIGLELIEAARWTPFLSDEGKLICNDELVPPVGKVIRDGGAGLRELLGSLQGAIVLDAVDLSGPAGSRGVNAALLGVASSVKGFPVAWGKIRQCIREEAPGMSGPLQVAFQNGRDHCMKLGRAAGSVRPKTKL
jgi:indolepyruvate ferredoxin oxidoreductase beta subunit